jgi:hypothetical protein
MKTQSNSDLRYIIEYVESKRGEAWQQLLQQSPSNEDLCYIIRYVESKREEAVARLLSGEKS